MGGSSKSSTASSNSTAETTFNTVDNRVGGDDAILGGNTSLNVADASVGDVRITTSDYGAVAGGLRTALEALEGGYALSENAISNNSVTIDRALDAISETNAVANQQTLQAIDRSFSLAGESSRTETATALNNFMKVMVVTVLGAGALFVAYKMITK